jgi:hypothetical protein
MSPSIGLPPPDPETCLVTSRLSRFRGGTLIDEDVQDLAAHECRLSDPDGYRPERCARCGYGVLHVHCYPERHPRGELGMPAVVRIIQYVCASAECGATWRILPMFLARHLWRAWKTVERVVMPAGMRRSVAAPPIPARTEQRWRTRFAASARMLIVLLAASGGGALEALASRVGLEASRAELTAAHADLARVAPSARLAALAELVHRLERGLRLM